jgi:SAM-dependent methyltransferase
LALLLVAAVLSAAQRPVSAQQPPQQSLPSEHGRLFPPENLGLLEGPDRAIWQKPDQIMDALGVADGSKVADIGAGAGWFTIRLARRVGPNGVVYAQDIQQQMLDAIRRRVEREGLRNVHTTLGSESSSNLPEGQLDAVLVVDTYPELRGDRVAYLKNLAAALKPDGRLGIVNYKLGGGGPGPSPSEGARIARGVVEAEALSAGLRVKAAENLPYQYLLVLTRQQPTQPVRTPATARRGGGSPGVR